MSNLIEPEIETIVMAIHRRNGGHRRRLDFGQPLLAPAWGLDSLDLAEIMVAIEKRFGVSPFNTATPPRTWGELAQRVRELMASSAKVSDR